MPKKMLIVYGENGGKFDQAIVEKCLKDLKDKDASVRRHAASALGEIGIKEYAKDVAELLKDNDSGVRCSVVYALRDIGAKEYAKDITTLLKDEEASVRQGTLKALIKFDAKEHAKDIVPLLKDKDESVRRSASVALSELGVNEGGTTEPAKLKPKPNLKHKKRKPLLTAKEVAKIMGISYNSALEAIRGGQIPTKLIGKRRVVLRKALSNFLNDRKNAGTTNQN